MLTTALLYARKGWRVIPINFPTNEGRCSCGNPGCPAVGKHPLISGWVDDASNDPDDIKKWWKAWPRANIGIAFGQRTGLIDIETDPRSGGDRNLPKLETKLGKLPSTLSYKSGGGGIHRLYLYPGDHRIRKATNIGKDLLGIADPKKPTGIDILSDGGQAVAPPSRHVSGRTYQWEDEDAIPQELPQSWVDYLAERPQEANSIEALLAKGPQELDDITSEKAKEILTFIDADCDYSEWMRIGQALRVQFQRDPDTGLAIFDEWSATAKTKYPGRRQVEKQWGSYGNNAGQLDNITFRSVIHIAKQQGYQPPKAMRQATNESEKQLRKADIKQMERFKQRLNAADIVEDLHEIAAEIRLVEMFDASRDELVQVLQKRYESIQGKKLSLKGAKSLLSDDAAKEQRAIELAEADNWYQSYIYLQDHRMGTFYDSANGQMMSPKVFDDTYSAKLITPIMRAQGKLIPIFPPTNLVLNSELIEKVSAPRYAPGRPIIYDDNGQRFANTYRGPQGEATDPMLHSDEEAAAIRLIEAHGEWMLGPDRSRLLFQFLAYIQQNPSLRVRWCYMIIGPKGIGKTFFGNLARAALGKANVRDIGQSTLGHTEFNSWSAGAQLNVIEEIRVEGTKKHEIMNALKAAITNDIVDVHRKGIDAQQQDNTASYLAFTNYANAIMVDAHDRRYFVTQTEFADVESFIDDLGGHASTTQYFIELFSTLKYDSAIRGWLENYPLTGFNPMRAPDSDEKSDLVDASMSDLEATIRRMINSTESGDRWNTKAIDLSALRAALSLDSDTPNITGQGLARVLRDMGFRQASPCSLDPLNDGKLSRWYVNPKYIKAKRGQTSQAIRDTFES